MTGDISSKTQLIGSNKMNKETTEQTDGLEPIIEELIKIQSLVESGYHLDTKSWFVYDENVGEISTYLQHLVHTTDANIRLHLIMK